MNTAALLALIGDLYAQHAAAMRRVAELEQQLEQSRAEVSDAAR